jgi:pyridoxamine 5'-phosphate oxidase
MNSNGSHFDFSQDPLLSFKSELHRASLDISKDPNAMTLATVSADCAPSIRTVLFKGLIRGGLSFYTNYNSQKSLELEKNPSAAALFFWNTLELQIRFEGKVTKLSRAEAEEYFQTRPRLSQVGAWASEQSKTIPNREFLQNRLEEFEKKFQGKDVPCPPHWGGWVLYPTLIEFWYGQRGRLHDRYCFERKSIDSQDWHRSLRSP